MRVCTYHSIVSVERPVLKAGREWQRRGLRSSYQRTNGPEGRAICFRGCLEDAVFVYFPRNSMIAHKYF